MNREASGFWRHAKVALAAARANLETDPATVANRAYYAAFYAVAALFTLEQKAFKKHSVLEALVHRELVNTGRWREELGADYRFLSRLRTTGDYDVTREISRAEAKMSVESATRILDAVRQMLPDDFPGLA